MLNQRQQEAVAYTEGPLLILAGAGAGKTKTIVERIINIVKKGTSPKNILAITFTNKAAKEMRERVVSRMKEENLTDSFTNFYTDLPMLKTFHSLGMYILQEEYERANLTKRLTIYDESDSMSIIKGIMERENIDTKLYEPRRVKGAISRLKGDFVDQNEYRQNSFSPLQKVVARVWPQYQNELNLKKVVDFDDLIVRTLLLLQDNEDLKQKYQNKWKYLHIDEYQDTNNTQYMLCKILAAGHKNICAVGDVDQNIYSWRGANLKNLMAFEEDFEIAGNKPKIVLLEQNYRSTKNIIEAANEIIKKNKVRKEKNLFTENEEGEVITVYTGYDDRNEAEYIAKTIKELIEEKRVSAGDIAVLYRTNFQSRQIEQALLSKNINYHVLGVRFFDRKEVKDIMSYLRLAENPESVEDMKRALSNPTRGFGKVAFTKIMSGNSQELNPGQQKKLEDFWNLINDLRQIKDTELPSSIVMKILVDSGIEKTYKDEGDEESLERLGNIYELVELAREYDKYESEALNKFLEEASLISDQDTDTNETNKVRLMTIHASKGLEFPYVFITGLEEDLFPSRKMFDKKPSAEENEEERRLFYVALTRARRKLYLTNAKNRMLFGKRQMQFRSEFLDDIPHGLVVEEEDRYSGGGMDGHEKIVVYL